MIYARFAAAVDELKNYGGVPSPQESQLIWDDIWHREAHNSTAIEGNTLVLRKVRTLLDENRPVGGKDLKDYMEVLGYAEAARWVYSQARVVNGTAPGSTPLGKLVSVAEIRNVHQLTMQRVWAVAPHPHASPDEQSDAFRRHDIRPFSGGMVPPPWVDVSPQLATWVDTANSNGSAIIAGKLEPSEIPIALAEMHSLFERIHPFIDGNGRTGRLVLNLILVRLGFPPAIIFKSSRNRYLTALDRADKGDLGPLAELLARSVIDNLNRLIVPNIAGPARLVLLKSLATPELSYQALRQAASRGRLDVSYSSDGTVRSSKLAVDAFLDSKYSR
ncbi:Fic family protein [Salinibacterium sp.]|uniref:Fic family protein n=1 Tax=Salinibacterium sp. TaxID=1915057 RepID=UPI00286B2F94|nr:Fic family protein [Salinibacterium sp.]